MALVLKKLYAGDLLNKANTAELLGYMQETSNDDLIPAAPLRHRGAPQIRGDGRELHDAALITYRGSTFVLVIYTENPEGFEEPEQAELIRKLTGAVEDALFPLNPAGK